MPNFDTILKAYSQHLIYTLMAKCIDINKYCTVHTGPLQQWSTSQDSS